MRSADGICDLGQRWKRLAGICEPVLRHDHRMRPAAPLPHQPRARPEGQIGCDDDASLDLQFPGQRGEFALRRFAQPAEGDLSVMYITDRICKLPSYRECFGKVKSEARPKQLITFTRRLHQARPVEDRDLPSTALDQTLTFQLLGSIRDGWPLHTQHFSEQVLGDRQYVLVAAVTHH